VVVPVKPAGRPAIVEIDGEDDSTDVEFERPPGSGREEDLLRSYGIRGRLGLRLARMDDLTGTSQDYTRPSLNLKASGDRIGGSAWGIDLDVRTRRTYRQLSDGTSPTESKTRVYRLSGRWQRPGSPIRVTAGRQASTSLAAVSVFDGVLGEYASSRRNAGIFFGYQPDYRTYGVSDDIAEAGGFVGFRRRGGPRRELSLTGGAVASYERGAINREYLFLQSRLRTPGTFLYFSQQIDVNRGWKREAEGRAFTFTNIYAHGRHDIREGTTVEAGYDNRRNIRLYRYRVTPETEFNDSYRQGFWTGVQQDFGHLFRAGLRGRTRTGGIRSATFTGRLAWREMRSLRIRSRTTVYENQSADGVLTSVSAGFRAGILNPIEVTRGLRDEKHGADPELDEHLTWTAVDASVNLGRHWYMWISAESNRGRSEKNDAIYSSLFYRF
jgi:hypothetical protein